LGICRENVRWPWRNGRCGGGVDGDGAGDMSTHERQKFVAEWALRVMSRNGVQSESKVIERCKVAGTWEPGRVKSHNMLRLEAQLDPAIYF